MASLKRCRETDLLIKVAAGEPLKADSLLVRSLCDSARGLPETEVWDVSGLLLDGQPFCRETVSCWLSCAYSAIHGSDQLGPQDIQLLSTVPGITEVLTFADAVGSYAAVCKAACSHVYKLKFSVKLPKQVLELPLAGTYYFSGKQLEEFNLGAADIINVGDPLSTDEQRSVVKQQVAKQAAALLQLAHKLHLQPLLSVLHQFLLFNVQPGCGHRLLSGAASLVFTDAVLEAASGSSNLSKETYISSVMSRPVSLTPGRLGHSSLLKPVEPSVNHNAENGTLEFDAQLMQDFAGAKAGDTVHVDLTLFGGGFSEGSIRMETAVSAAEVWMPVQLLMGHTFSNAAALEGFLNKEAPC